MQSYKIIVVQKLETSLRDEVVLAIKVCLPWSQIFLVTDPIPQTSTCTCVHVPNGLLVPHINKVLRVFSLLFLACIYLLHVSEWLHVSPALRIWQVATILYYYLFLESCVIHTEKSMYTYMQIHPFIFIHMQGCQKNSKCLS